MWCWLDMEVPCVWNTGREIMILALGAWSMVLPVLYYETGRSKRETWEGFLKAYVNKYR